VTEVRRDFPILSTVVNGSPLVYLDNAATTQKPRQVIETIQRYYEAENSNIHRGVHHLSQVATEAFEAARRKAQSFLNARSPQEIVFVRGATEGVNLVAQSFARGRLQPGDAVLITAMEHHSNIVPWQIVCEQTGAVLKVLPMNARGELLLDRLPEMLGEKTKLFASTHVSNALGTVNPIDEMIRTAHRHGVPVLIDAAQSAPHLRIDVRSLDADFLVFSGHKVYGPTGIGVLYGKAALLDAMPPYQGGGDMIRSVTFEKTTYNELPYKFEAGTPHIAGAIGLGAALDYVEQIGLERIERHEAELLNHAHQVLRQWDEVRIVGEAGAKAGVVSFLVNGIHPHDVGTILDQQGIAIRTGHHCAQPVMDFFGVPATARASLGVYNTLEELDALASALKKVLEVFS